MPLQQGDIDYLNSIGVNPNEYDVDPSGNSYIPRQPISTQPAVSGTEFQHPKTSTSSAIEVFGKTALHEAPSMAAGGFGFARGMAAGARLPIPHPAGRAAAGLLGGVIGGLGLGGIARFLQGTAEKAVIPEQIAALEQGQAEHPMAALSGQIATMPLSGMNPSPTRLAQAVGYGGRWMTGLRPPPEQIANIANVGIGAALQPAIATGQRLVSGEPITGKDLLLETLLGALFNKPNAIGRRYGFTDIPTSEHPDINALLAAEQAPRPAVVETMPTMSPTEIVSTGGAPLSHGLKQTRKATDKVTAAFQPREAFPAGRDPIELQTELARLEAEGGISSAPPQVPIRHIMRPEESVPVRNLQRQRDFILAQKELVDAKTALAESKQRQQITMKLGVKATPEAIAARGVSGPEARPTAVETTPTVKPLPQGFSEAERIQQQLESKPRAKTYQSESSAVEAERPFTEQERTMMEKLKERNIPTDNLNIWENMLAKWAGKERGVDEVKIEPTLDIAGQSQTEWLGNKLGKVLIQLGRKRGIETLPHEIAHPFLQALEKSPHAYDRALAKRYYRMIEASPEFADINKARVAQGRAPWDAHEFATTEAGTEYVKNRLNLEQETPLKSWWNDFTAHIRTRFGKEATQADLRRLLNYRFMNDAGFHDMFKTGIKVGESGAAATNIKESESSPTRKLGGESEEGKTPNPFTYDELVRGTILQKAMRIGSENAITAAMDASNDPFFQSAEEAKAIQNKVDEAGAILHPERQSESSIVPINHPDIKSVLDSTINQLKEQTLSTNDARELKSTLLQQLDFSKHDKLRAALDNVDAGSMTSWIRFRAALNNAVAGKDIPAELVPAKTVEPAKVVKVETTKEPEEKPHVPVKVEPADFSPYKDQWEQQKAWDAEWKEINTTQNPAELARIIGRRFMAQKYPRTKAHYLAQYQYLVTKYDVPDLPRLSESSITAKPSDALPDYEKPSFMPFLTSRVDKIAEALKGSPSEGVANYVAVNLHKFSGEADRLAGQYGNKPIAIARQLSQDQVDKVYHYLHQVDNNGQSFIRLTGQEKKVADELVEALREPRKKQIEEGPLVKENANFRVAGIKPEGYMHNMLDPKVAYTWAEHPSSTEAKAYDKAYIDHLISKGVNAEEAKKRLFEYKGALGDRLPAGPTFNAIRLAEGKGLPWELVDKNFASASTRYGRRAARDLAFFKYIQKDPKMLKALNLPDQFGNLPKADSEPSIDNISDNRAVQDAMRSVFGIDMPRNPRVMAAARLANNTVMGVGTAARNVLNMPAFLGAYVQTKQLPLVAKAISHLNDSRVRAFENNAVRTTFADYDVAGFYEGNPNPAINLLNKFSSYLRRYQGRDLSDKFEGQYYFSLGELLAQDNIIRAKAGNKESKRFLERFGDLVDGDIMTKQVTPEDISKIAKRFTDAARGTYSEEGLPSWAIEGELAPFAALSRFAIEKSNTIWKDVILPAKKGIYGPLIRYTLASLGIGAGIEQLNELLTNKRGVEPKINEILASGNEVQLVPKAISLLQLASFAGIVGDAAKLVSNAYQGKTLRYNQPMSFPLYTLMTDTLAGNISDAAKALQEGEDPFDVLGTLAVAISTQSLQTARYIDANFVRPDEAARREKFRDVNVYGSLAGYEKPQTSDRPNLTAGLEAKKFKKTQDIEEAAAILPDLINKAITKADGDPEKLKSELIKLKLNSYQTMPNPENLPLRFYNYYLWLQETQGPEEAAARLTDYLTQTTVNKAKAELVP